MIKLIIEKRKNPLIQIKKNKIKLQTIVTYLNYVCNICNSEQILLFTGAKKYTCQNCKSDILVKKSKVVYGKRNF